MHYMERCWNDAGQKVLLPGGFGLGGAGGAGPGRLGFPPLPQPLPLPG